MRDGNLSRDSAQASLALPKINTHVENNTPIYTHVTYVSDGAAAHLKDTGH